MTQVAASVPANAISSTLMPWRNHVLVCTDAYRGVLFSDGVNLKIATAPTGQTGETWSLSPALLGGASVTPLIDAVFFQNALWLLVATSTSSGGSINGLKLYKVPYSGAGVFNVAGMTSVTIAPTSSAGYAAPPLSARLIADLGGTTLDSRHTAGTTGLLHALVDLGGTWWLHAIDPNSSVTPANPFYSQSLSSGVTGPTGATNAILRATSDIYAITPGSAAWLAREITFSSVNTNIPAGNGPTFFSWPLPARGPNTVLASGYYTLGGSASWLAVTSTPTGAGSRVYTAPTGGVSFAAGTWFVETAFTTDTRMMYGLRARIYHQTAAGALTLIGSLPLGFSGSTNNSCSGPLPAFSLPAGDTLYVEVDAFVSNDFGTSDSITGTSTGGSVLTPPSTIGGATQVVNSYTIGSAEAPGLVVSPYGAALCFGDTSTNPSIDAFVYRSDLAKIQTIHRYNNGGYANPLNIGGVGLVAGGVAASQNATTGEEDVFALATFSGVTHVGRMSKSSDTGTWGTFAQEDTAGVAVTGRFGAVGAGSLGKIGPAIIYLSNANLFYEDANFAASQTAPLQPTVILVESSTGAGDVAGQASPFNTTDANPKFRLTYLHNNLSDPMSGYQPEVTHGAGPTIDWNPGLISIGTGGPTSGQTDDFSYPTSGDTPLVAYTTYSLTVATQDVMSGKLSTTSAVCKFTLVTAPLIFLDMPTDITTFVPRPIIGFWHDQLYAWNSFELLFEDALGKALVDTGQQGFANDMQPAVLSSAASSGANQIVSSKDLSPDSLISLGAPGDTTFEYQTVRTSVSNGSGAWTVTLVGTLTNGQTSGTRVYACYTVPNVSLWPGLANDTTYTAKAIGWVDPPAAVGGAAWAGNATLVVTTDFPKPPQPHDLSVAAEPGLTPLAGGWLLARWLQDAATGNEPAPAATNLFYRLSGTADWIVATPAPLPVIIGEQDVRLVQIPNGKAVDIAVSSVSSQGVESNRTIWYSATLQFRLGIWFNEMAAPATMIEVGRVPTSANYPLKWGFQMQLDEAQLFNRVGLVLTPGSTFARKMPAAVEFTLDRGHEDAQLTQFESWLQHATKLLVRDPHGAVFVGVIVDVQEGSGMRRDYRTVALTVKQADPGLALPTTVVISGAS